MNYERHCPGYCLGHNGAVAWHPGKLRGLLEMLHQYAAGFTLLMKLLMTMEQGINRLLNETDPKKRAVMAKLAFEGVGKKERITSLHDDLILLRKHCDYVPCKSFAAQIDRIMKSFEEKIDVKLLHSQFNDLLLRLEDDLEGQFFYYVPAERTSFYVQKNLFGETVPERLPEAMDDIESGGQCLALGQGTAAVFHMMRVMEAGLRRLAELLGIPYAPSWESYIKQISVRIEEKHSGKSVDWKKNEHFFRDILGDLQAIKISWRNPTMHIDRRYSPDEAAEIFAAVRVFIQRLLPKLKPPKKKRRPT